MWKAAERIRERTPLIHNITNTVAANFAANGLIAVGASPMMGSEPRESASLTGIANALTINIGTLNDATLEAMNNSAQEANKKGIPWVLDPVGIGATKMRQDACRTLVALGPTIIRGNASEIACLCGVDAHARGIDSTMSTEAVLPYAKQFAASHATIVVVSGATDFITDGRRTARVINGHPLMGGITASGCTLTCILGAFAATTTDPFWAACYGLTYYAVAGEIAALHAKGTGSMHKCLLDELSGMSLRDFEARARPPIDLSLYLVTDPQLNLDRPIAEIVRAAIEGGVTVVQLREKNCDSGEFLVRARAVKNVCEEYDVPLLINDRVDIALAVDAAGVHIGQSDLPVPVARELLGRSKIIGLSADTPKEISDAEKQDVDYLGIGPVYSTATKKDAKAELGLAKLNELSKSTNHLTVAIGGISVERAQLVREQSVDGIAVVTAITMANDVTRASKMLLGSN